MNLLIRWFLIIPELLYTQQTEMENMETIQFSMSLAILLLNIISYLYISVKFFKVLCYAKLTCDWFPMLNPYNWPFSFLQTITNPYFRFWSKILPSLKFKKSSVEISGIIALEALNAIIYFCVRSVNVLVVSLDYMDKAVPL
jgi:uncharacterized protein YggT (Ycf19 family)